VDDDAGALSVLQMILEDEGYSTAQAANGREALERIAERRPDLILLDLRMPVMGGWELQALLQAEAEPIPIVFLSAIPHLEQQAQEHAAATFLAKPFELDELLRIVERFARRPSGS